MSSLQINLSSAVTVWVALCIKSSTCLISPFVHKPFGFLRQPPYPKVPKTSCLDYLTVPPYSDTNVVAEPTIPLLLDKESHVTNEDLMVLEPNLSPWDLEGLQDTDHDGSDVGSVGSKRLVSLSDKKEDILDLIDIEEPYYALQNEHEIMVGDGTTGEQEGFVCSVHREMPVSRENGGISFGEVGRHSAAAASVAAALKNPKKSRHHYLASEYFWEVVPRQESVIDQQMASVMNKNKFPTRPDGDECTIYCRCDKIEKRSAFVDIYFETKDSRYHATLKLIIVPARAFKATIPKESEGVKLDQVTASSLDNPYVEKHMCGSSLKVKNVFNKEFHDDWITVEASLDTVKSRDCLGHFYEGCTCATPHSLMLLHNGDLIGQAISKLTGRCIPYKKSHEKNKYTDDWGIEMVDWKCEPLKLNYADSEGLDFQVKAYLSEGQLGEAGSKYAVQCRVMGSESKEISYESSGTFVLAKVHRS